VKQQPTDVSSEKTEEKKRTGALGVNCMSCGVTFFKVDIFLNHSCVTRSNRERMA
jgi:hypothetical protein